MTEQRQIVAADLCDHYATEKGGHHSDAKCQRCGWIYRIGLTGSRWVSPDYEPPPLAEILRRA